MSYSADDSPDSFEILTPTASNSKGQPIQCALVDIDSNPSFSVAPSLISIDNRQNDFRSNMQVEVDSASEHSALNIVSICLKKSIEIDGVKYVQANMSDSSDSNFNCEVQHGIDDLATEPVATAKDEIDDNATPLRPPALLEPTSTAQNSLKIQVKPGIDSYTAFINSLSFEDANQFRNVMNGQPIAEGFPKFMRRVFAGLQGELPPYEKHANTPQLPLSDDPFNSAPNNDYLASDNDVGGVLYRPWTSIGRSKGCDGFNEYFCSEPFLVVVGESGMAYHVHKHVLAISPVLEKMCLMEEAKNSASIALPEDDPVIFEYLLGYLYFGRYEARTRWDCMRNEELMNTYVMAGKYELEELKPMLLASFDVVPVHDFIRVARIVYVAEADDYEFSQFFKGMIIKAIDRNIDKILTSCNGNTWEVMPSICNIADEATVGGTFARDLTEALLEGKPYTRLDALKCQDCGMFNCKCGAELNDDGGQTNHDNKDTHDIGWNGVVADTQVDEEIFWRNNGHAEVSEEPSKKDVLGEEVKKLKEKMENLEVQLGNQPEQARGPGSGVQEPTISWPCPAAQRPLHEQGRVGVRGHQQPTWLGRGSSWGVPPAVIPSPVQLAHEPPNRQSWQGQTATAVLNSDPSHCTLVFPAGARIMNMVPFSSWGEAEFEGSYNGARGSFPERYVQVDPTMGMAAAGSGW